MKWRTKDEPTRNQPAGARRRRQSEREEDEKTPSFPRATELIGEPARDIVTRSARNKLHKSQKFDKIKRVEIARFRGKAAINPYLNA
jgi:hypothetical protein